MKYYLQCTTWRGKKQVVFLHRNLVEHSKDNISLRQLREGTQRIAVKGPTIQKYSTPYYSTVDINDRDSAENTVSIRTS